MKRLVSALLLLSAASFFAADSIQLLSDPGMKTASGWKAFWFCRNRPEQNGNAAHGVPIP